MSHRLFSLLVPISILASTVLSAQQPYDSQTSSSNSPSNPTTTGKKTKKPPNFVLLFMDDLGYGDMGFTGHPTTQTPNLDRLAWGGMVLTTFYSACSACTGSRAGLMTGRQWPRTGLPNVLTSTTPAGLNLNETTIAQHLKLANYSTAIVGKWHLGQRKMYLPTNRGFDSYLGIPYSDDMGDALPNECPVDDNVKASGSESESKSKKQQQSPRPPPIMSETRKEEIDEMYRNRGGSTNNAPDDPARFHLPLVHQEKNQTTIVEQPLDFGTLAQKYNQFATDFIRDQAQSDNPFFLYVPFSHVHVTSNSQKEKQYAGCGFQNSTKRGKFGDALAEADWIVGNIHQTLKDMNLEENTLILFTSDNGPWLSRGLSAG
ncbi:MAG: hypothetical protein SGILL_008917, partial [Bacillariaceae sp.]